MEASFWDQLVEDDKGCWLHVGWSSDTYGEVMFTPQRMGSHRYTYTALVGPIPAGLHIDHLCRVRGCVNPGHLEPVTKGENTLRGQGFAAINAAKTHCLRGHPYSPENTLYHARGKGRVCRTCDRARQKAWRQRRREYLAEVGEPR